MPRALVAFRERHPRDRDLALDVDLLRPVRILHRLQGVAERRKSFDIGRGGLRIARPRGAERAREVRDRVGVRKRALGAPCSDAASAHAPRSSAYRAGIAAAAYTPATPGAAAPVAFGSSRAEGGARLVGHSPRIAVLRRSADRRTSGSPSRAALRRSRSPCARPLRIGDWSRSIPSTCRRA